LTEVSKQVFFSVYILF